jgi:hypothetical protein
VLVSLVLVPVLVPQPVSLALAPELSLELELQPVSGPLASVFQLAYSLR